jgi:hypothetical protein
LSLAKQHVAAVEKYPELCGMTQRGALATAKEWDGFPEEVREQVRETWREPAAPPQADAPTQAPRTTTAAACLRRPADPDPFWHRATQGLAVFLAKTEKLVTRRNQTCFWNPTARQNYLHELRRAQERVAMLIAEIEQHDTEPTSEHGPGQPHAGACQGSTIEPPAPRRGEPPGRGADFEACREQFIGRVKTLLASGASWSGAARRLNAEGMPTPNGVKSWNHRTLKRLAEEMGIDRKAEGVD